MAANINIRNWIRSDDGARINAATVEVFASGTLGVPTTTPSATTSSEATEGRWAFEGLDDATIWDVKITSGSQVRWLKGGASAQWHNLAAYNLFIKNAFTLNNLTVAQTATVGTLSGTAGVVNDLRVPNTLTVGTLSVTAGRATDLAVTNGLSVGSLSANLVPQLTHRQGGSATDWNTAGTTNYTPGTVRIQAGSITAGVMPNGTTANVSITFPVAFSAVPILLAIPLTNSFSAAYSYKVGSVTAAAAQVDLVNNSGGEVTPNIHWVAIGPA